MPYRKPAKDPMLSFTPTAQFARKGLAGGQGDTSIADLCINHIETHVKSGQLYREQLSSLFNANPGGVQALTTIAVNSMINSLKEDPSPANFETVISHAPSSLLNSIIDSPKLHYTSMLRFAEQKGWDNLKDDSRRDIWILKNELFIRAEGSPWGLLSLEDSDIVFAHCSKIENGPDGEPAHRLITRKIAPKSGVQYLDQKRPRTIKIQPSTEAYKKAFDRLMGGALEGLDWNNVFVAGGMALSALLAVDPAQDDQYKSNDIDMYIYGLTPEKANEKIKHIAEIWQKNLKPGEEKVMVKNARTVTLLATYPSRRIQIILKAIKNPASVLLNFDLDQVAIGYTGESVLFLPRCARALETGYTIFTLDMIHGHHLNERRETQEERLFKYAKRGFGVRILPEFCDMVKINFAARRPTRTFTYQAIGDMRQDRYGFTWYQRDNEDASKATPDIISGVKAVRRVFAAGEDMVYRFYIGRTEVTAKEDYDDEDPDSSDDDRSSGWGNSDYYKTPIKGDDGEEIRVPKAQFNALDTYRSGVGAPHGKRGLGCLEMHARHCALYRFDCEKKLSVDYNSLASTTYDTDSYDMLPQYTWDESFRPSNYVTAINTYNDDLFRNLCDVMENNEAWRGVRNYNRKLKGYLTRRIRRIAHSDDINELIDRFQIVVPIMIHPKLEDFIKETFTQALVDAGIMGAEGHEILIPIHKPGMGDGSLPDLAESTEKNVRYWLIDSTTMWAGLDRRIDEIFDLLWNLFIANDLTTQNFNSYGASTDVEHEWYEIIASFLLRRVTRLSVQQLGIDKVEAPPKKDDGNDGEEIEEEVSAAPENLDEDIMSNNPIEVPNLRDRYLFTKWLAEQPVSIYRSYQYEVKSSYRESNNETAPPDVMYWREGIDGTSDEWTEWVEGQPGFEPICTFRKMPRAKQQREDGRSNSDDDWADRIPSESEDAEGEAADAPGEPPRGVKRRREDTDPNLSAMLDDQEREDRDDAMADAPGGSR